MKSMLRSRLAQAGLFISGALLAGSLSAESGKAELLQLAATSEGFDAEQTYMQSCFACHNSGAAGAPKVGDSEAWAPRLEKGMEEVIANAINGMNGTMPPKGLCFSCSDEDLAAVVQYMVDNSK